MPLRLLYVIPTNKPRDILTSMELIERVEDSQDSLEDVDTDELDVAIEVDDSEPDTNEEVESDYSDFSEASYSSDYEIEFE